MDTTDNPELALAKAFVQHTGANVFLTGKAGTGKTTFLHSIKQSVPKRMVVAAPTGVAAINAGGVTLHSFFQLPFGPYLPIPEQVSSASQSAAAPRFNRTKIDIIRTLDLLIIDEISMVRADTMDAIDATMRRYRNKNEPFGGVQLLMIGDLQQLAPVCAPNEWELLQNHYQSPYFFESQALKAANYTVIELQHIYRQSDKHFIELLNGLRQSEFDSWVLEELNKRYVPNFQYKSDDGYIFLTSHNAKAKRLNTKQLEQLPGQAQAFAATITGDFPEIAYPTDELLELKLGTQVMFVKNDPTPAKRFFNGKLGTVTKISNDYIEVTPFEESEPLAVTPLEWKNLKYTIDAQSHELVETEAGSFTQYPLKAAWAITIHKSQGLTFDKTIIDAGQAFTHGQVYVALSRCKSLDGIVLSSKLVPAAIISDATVEQYTDASARHKPTPAILQRLKKNYYVELLLELFDFADLRRRLAGSQRRMYAVVAAAFAAETAEPAELVSLWQTQMAAADREIFGVSSKFQKELLAFYNPPAAGQGAAQQLSIAGDTIPENDRIYKGCHYLIDKIDSIFGRLLGRTNELLAARSVADSAIDGDTMEACKAALDALIEAADVKRTLLQATAENGFSVSHYLQTRAVATLNHTKTAAKGWQMPPKPTAVTNIDTKHLSFFNELKQWRQAEAERQNLPLFIVARNSALAAIAAELPRSEAELLALAGVGRKFVSAYGSAVLALVRAHLDSVS